MASGTEFHVDTYNADDIVRWYLCSYTNTWTHTSLQYQYILENCDIINS